jgi:methionyl-tRNA synthetase
MIDRLAAAGDLYLGTYAGYYCVRCEAYKTEDELEPLAPEPLEGQEPDAGNGERSVADRRCPLHPSRAIVWLEEENWFFRLSRYRDRLLALLEERPEFVQPDVRRNEVLRVLEGGLDDISVSRSRLPWGVPWPGGSSHTVYVWIDALTNYLSAIGFPDDDYQQWWPADVHVIGKDITRFHCIYWPAMLLSAGIALPRTVWAHGFLTFEGRRFSKSAGVWVDLDQAIDRHGPEALRYYLLRDVPWNGDGDFSWQRFDARYTAELADDLGNLANRTLTMVERYRDGVVPEGEETSLDRDLASALTRYRTVMDDHLLHQGAAAALELAAAANAFVGDRAPWTQAKDPALATDLDATLASLVRALLALASMLQPFMPAKMARLAEQAGSKSVPTLEELPALPVAGLRVRRGDILFPKDPALSPA